MRLLISLVTDTRESVLQPMDFIDFRKCEEFCSVFDLEALTAWQETAADVTFYFRWTEDRAWGMTYARLKWWVCRPPVSINSGIPNPMSNSFRL